MKRILLLLVLFSISACSSIDYKQGPIAGLESMTVEEHYVDGDELYARCSRCGHLGLELPVACTCINFRLKRAVIWLPRDASQATVEHERAHSRGYDHPNGELGSRYAAWQESVEKLVKLASQPKMLPESGITRVSDSQ